jgi:FixJ family two-component response regulator
MVMPDIDGNELVLWLVDRGCEADIIIITGYHPDYAVNARLLAEYKGMRSVATLSKPVSIARLRQALMAAAGADAGIAAPDTEPDGEPGLQE